MYFPICRLIGCLSDVTLVFSISIFYSKTSELQKISYDVTVSLKRFYDIIIHNSVF